MLLTEENRLIKKVFCTDIELVVRFSGSAELNIQLSQRAEAADHLDRFEHYKTQQARGTEGVGTGHAGTVSMEQMLCPCTHH